MKMFFYNGDEGMLEWNKKGRRWIGVFNNVIFQAEARASLQSVSWR